MAEQNVGTIINVGASLEGCWRSVELAHQYPFVYAAVGIHPDEVGDLNEESFARLRETARMEEKVVAIGEIGLDYHWDVQPHEVQKYWFVKQIELAKELDHATLTFSSGCDQIKGIFCRINIPLSMRPLAFIRMRREI